MRSKKMLILFLTVLCVVLAMMFCSCSLFGGGDDSGSSSGQNNPPKQEEEGWTTVENPNIYNAFLLGCTNVAFQGSKSAIEGNKGVMTMDSKLKLTLDGSSLWIILKGKYKKTAQDDPKDTTIVSFEICTEETPTADNRIIGVYLYKNKLYFALGKDFEESQQKNNKVSVSLNNFAWTEYFPYEMERMDSKKISGLSGVLASSLMTNKANKGEYRRKDGVDEYRYSMDIDLAKSIPALFETLSKPGVGIQAEIVKKAKEFVAVFYGIEESEVMGDNIPDSNVVINFSTHNSIISALNCSFDIDLKGRTQLFDGGKMQSSVSMEKLSIGKDYSAVKIPFANDDKEQKNYVSFTGSTFSVDIPLDEYRNNNIVANNSMLKITTKFYQGDSREDFVFAEYRDKETNNLKKGIYIYNDILYFFALKDGAYTCLCSLDVNDIGDLATRIATNDLGGTNTFEPTKLFAYIINGVSLEQSSVRFSIKPNFYSDVWYNFEDLCSYIDSFVEENVLEVPGIRDFYDYVKTNEVIMTLRTDVPFMNIITGSDTYINGVVSMLGEVSADTRLTPVGAGE